MLRGSGHCEGYLTWFLALVRRRWFASGQFRFLSLPLSCPNQGYNCFILTHSHSIPFLHHNIAVFPILSGGTTSRRVQMSTSHFSSVSPHAHPCEAPSTECHIPGRLGATRTAAAGSARGPQSQADPENPMGINATVSQPSCPPSRLYDHLPSFLGRDELSSFFLLAATLRKLSCSSFLFLHDYSCRFFPS